MQQERLAHLQRLSRELPEGLLADGAWLESKGISSSLRSYYVKHGWLDQPARGVYRRKGGEMTAAVTWEQVVVSLQLLLRRVLVVGGESALNLQGHSQFYLKDLPQVYLHGPDKPPFWIERLGLPQEFCYRNSRRLFRNDPITDRITNLAWRRSRTHILGPGEVDVGNLKELAFGQWDWPLLVSKPERAYLEMLDEVPDEVDFDHANLLMQGAAILSSKRLQELLENCVSVKVKRLFFFFADRWQHQWLNGLDKDRIDFGSGKRVLAKGGRLDPTYLITAPAELEGIYAHY